MRGISPSTFKQQRKREGAFRCEVCDCLYPRSFQEYQDGLIVCRVTCLRSMGLEDIDKANAEALREASTGPSQYEENPAASTLNGQALVYSVSTPAQLPTTGGSTVLTITGINLTGVTFTATPLTCVTAVAAGGLSATVTVTAAAGTARGDYSLSCSIRTQGPIRKNFIKVR